MSTAGASRLRQPPRETVELTESEHVVPRGSARTKWFVRVRDGWTAAGAMPGARVEAVSPGPGMVWTRRIQLELARGTLLMQIVSAPQPVRRTPLEFLESSTTSRRRVLRTLHRVGRAGTLLRQPVPQAPRTRG
jgi:hypothetical protein